MIQYCLYVFFFECTEVSENVYTLFYLYNSPMNKINVFTEWGFFHWNRNEATHSQQLSLTLKLTPLVFSAVIHSELKRKWKNIGIYLSSLYAEIIWVFKKNGFRDKTNLWLSVCFWEIKRYTWHIFGSLKSTYWRYRKPCIDTKSKENKSKNKKWDYIKRKSFCIAEEIPWNRRKYLPIMYIIRG